LSDPLTPGELKRRCQEWPADVVRSAVLAALNGMSPIQGETEALSSLIAIWLTEPEVSEAPPLAPVSIRLIWKQLTAHLQ
jgi:hypothetical protein